MKFILVLWLSLCVPVTALATTVNLAPCEHSSGASESASSGHEHADHASPSNDTHQCSHCSSGHCVSGPAGLVVGAALHFPARYSHAGVIVPYNSDTAAAHSNGLLRPPDLI
jgi:hypothetical protein